jgi:hypothetical protein
LIKTCISNYPDLPLELHAKRLYLNGLAIGSFLVCVLAFARNYR